MVAVGIARIGLVDGDVVADDGVRTAEFEQVDIPAHVHETVEQKAGAHRRIEERVAVGVSEGRRPVVTGRHVEEERLFEAERDSSEDRVEPFALQSHGRAVHVEIRRVEDVGLVGAAVARSDELALLVEQAHVVRTCLHHAGAEGGVEREIVPRMVVLGEQVRIELFAEVAVVVHFAVGVFIAVGRRVVVAYVVFVGALVAHAARERKSVDDLVFDRSAEFVAVAFDDGAFAVEQPVEPHLRKYNHLQFQL